MGVISSAAGGGERGRGRVTGEGVAAGPGGELGPRGAGTGDGRSSTVWLGEERGVRGLRALGRLGFVRRLSGL